jgi:hypothetical protein
MSGSLSLSSTVLAGDATTVVMFSGLHAPVDPLVNSGVNNNLHLFANMSTSSPAPSLGWVLDATENFNNSSVAKNSSWSSWGDESKKDGVSVEDGDDEAGTPTTELAFSSAGSARGGGYGGCGCGQDGFLELLTLGIALLALGIATGVINLPTRRKRGEEEHGAQAMQSTY